MMNKLFKPVSLLMYLLVILVFFMAGMTIAGVMGVAEGQGLAGGAIVFFYGVITAIIAFILALFIGHNAKLVTIIKINNIFGILLLLGACLFVYRVVTLNNNNTPEKELPTKTTTSADKEISMVSFKKNDKPVLLLQISESTLGIYS